MINVNDFDLPIVHITDNINNNLMRLNQLIIEAQPGAGKTTLVPLSILHHQIQTTGANNWLGDKKIIMLEPRRIAARNAAMRMADLLNEKPGQTVGYRMRGETASSSSTRIEVVTQGVLTRMLQSDPALESVGAILFDEFHERQLDSDLALSLCQYTNQLLREDDPIKLIVMSATLEKMPLDKVLDQAETLYCQGRSYDVEITYCPQIATKKPNTPYLNQKQQIDLLLDHTVETTLKALSLHSGSVLVFLPGIREIKYCQTALGQSLKNDANILVTPLYGGLSAKEQQSAIQPCAKDNRKIVLTTSIAETSLTIDGVSIVIDSGLSRLGEFDASTGLSRLVTKPVSRATATQRAGRAGRLSAGVCYRLWSDQDHYQKQEHAPPEIKQADLTDTLLQLAQMGITPSELDWLDTPPQSNINQAIEKLKTLNAIHKDSNSDNLIITARGEKIAKLPIPTLAASVVVGCEEYRPASIENAIRLVSLLLDGDILFSSSASKPLSTDISTRLSTLKNSKKYEYPTHHTTMDALFKRYKKLLDEDILQRQMHNSQKETDIGELCALALPHRIAKQIEPSGIRYKLASGETVELNEGDPLRKYEWLVVIDVFNQNRSTQNQTNLHNQSSRIRMAAPLDVNTLFDKKSPLSSLNIVKEYTLIGWQDASNQLVATQSLKVGCLIINEKKLSNLTPEIKLTALLNWIKETKLEYLPWNTDTDNLQAKVALINASQLNLPQPNLLPDLSRQALAKTVETWLSPYLNNITRQKQLEKLPLTQILLDQLTWEQQQVLEQLAPNHITAPSGSKVKIDYTQNPPVIAVKLQEMFGCTETPKINNGKTALMIHLLSPARRPLQITQDLKSFWENGYQEVKKENKAKYAKHPWPDDPMQAVATRLTNRKLREKKD